MSFMLWGGIFIGLVLAIAFWVIRMKREKGIGRLDEELHQRALLAQTLAVHPPNDFRNVSLADLGGRRDRSGNQYDLVADGPGGMTIRGRSLKILNFGNDPVMREVDVTFEKISPARASKKIIRRSGL